MSCRYRECRVCRGAMDPGEGCGGVCDECIQKEAEKSAREGAFNSMFSSEAGMGFRQMEMEEFLHV